MACGTSSTSASWLQSMKLVFVPVLALKSLARSTPPKLMAFPTSWHMCSNRLMFAYGKPYGATYIYYAQEQRPLENIPKRSQILVPSLVVFQTAILFAHVSLTSTRIASWAFCVSMPAWWWLLVPCQWPYLIAPTTSTNAPFAPAHGQQPSTYRAAPSTPTP